MSLYLLRLKKFFFIFRSFRLFKAFILYRVLPSIDNKSIFSYGKFDTILDVGANRGQFSLLARYFSPYAKIISFEPLALPYSIYNKIFQMDKNIISFNSAISEFSELTNIEFFVSNKDDSSSALPITRNQTNIFPETFLKEKLHVSSASLNVFIDGNMIKGLSLLKIDVQGYEYEVLNGCSEFLEKFNYVYCETSFIELYKGQKLASDVIDYLKNYNFKLIGVFNMQYTKQNLPIQADLLFINNKI